MKRIEKLRGWLDENQCDAFFIHSYENRRYFTGFTGSNGYVLITQNDAVLITDQRYGEQAHDQATGYSIYIHEINPYSTLLEVLNEVNARKIAYEGKHLSVTQFNELKKLKEEIEWIYTEDVGINIRQIKDEKEKKNIKEAIAIGDKAFQKLCKIIKPGMTEKEIAIELEYLLAKQGSEGPTFGTIVAAGVRSSLPHAKPSNRIVNENELLLIDFGAKFNGYMSDMTRTLWIGDPGERLKRIYNLVLEALEKSIEAVKPGVECTELDGVARDVFYKAGKEKYSLRGLGHGVGLHIHEWPRVVMNEHSTLEEGMIFTIEPGLYIPGVGGVRIEDIVEVTESGCEVLTKTPRNIKY